VKSEHLSYIERVLDVKFKDKIKYEYKQYKSAINGFRIISEEDEIPETELPEDNMLIDDV